MAKVEIITRAFNRLEYTVKCVREIDEMAGMDDYAHIIINQNSTDGTKQWLDSLLQEGYYKLKIKHNKVNTGDAGGMKDGFDLIDEDCKYIMQFDNDCVPITHDFLRILVETMDNDVSIGAIMMKRENVINVIQADNVRSIGGFMFGDITKGTCCMIMRRETIQTYDWWRKGEKIGWGHRITERMKNDGYKVLKALDLRVEHVDGSEGQTKKYPNYFKKKINNTIPTNFTIVDYEENK